MWGTIENCPKIKLIKNKLLAVLGMCRSESSKGIFRRKTSSASLRSSRLAPPSLTSQSCPTSPRYASRSQRSSRVEPSIPSTSSGSRPECGSRIGSSSSSAELVGMSGESCSARNGSTLHRSASSVSTYKQGSNQSGYTYTGIFNYYDFYFII